MKKYFKQIALTTLFFAVPLALFTQQNQDQQKMKPPKGLVLPAQQSKLNSAFNPAGSVFYKLDIANGGFNTIGVKGSWNVQKQTSTDSRQDKILSFSGSDEILTTQTGEAYSSNTDDWLITPTIELPANDNPAHPTRKIMLSFNEMYETESFYDFGEVKITTNDGKTWDLLDVRSGKSDWRQTGINISWYAGEKVKIGFHFTSDESNNYIGWKVKDVILANEPIKADITSISTVRNIRIPANFVYLDVAVSGTCPDLDKLGKANFEIKENNDHQDILYLTPPGIGGGVRATDIVFLMDNSGSMAAEINAVSNNVHSFLNQLKSQGLDVALGLCRFGQDQNNGNPMIMNSGILMTNVDAFKAMWDAVNNTSGFREPGWDALVNSANGFTFRPGSQKVFILITDETAHCPNDDNIGVVSSADAATQVMIQHSITVFSLIKLDYCTSVHDYSPISDATNGATYDIFSSFDDILSKITSVIANTYKITYQSTHPYCDGQQRNVVVKVIY